MAKNSNQILKLKLSNKCNNFNIYFQNTLYDQRYPDTFIILLISKKLVEKSPLNFICGTIYSGKRRHPAFCAPHILPLDCQTVHRRSITLDAIAQGFIVLEFCMHHCKRCLAIFAVLPSLHEFSQENQVFEGPD